MSRRHHQKRVRRTPKKRPRVNRRRQAKRAKRSDGCSGKVRYASGPVAKVAAENLMDARGYDFATVYLCRTCTHYHVSRIEGQDTVYVLQRVTEAGQRMGDRR